MTDGERKPGELSSLMSTVDAIVEAVLEGQGLTLSVQRQTAWKAAQREAMAHDQQWRGIGWNRA